MEDNENIPEEYLDENGVLNEKGLAHYKTDANFDIVGKQVEIDEPEPRRIK